MSGKNIENATNNELTVANDNIQQYIGEPNMFHPNNIVTASYAHDTEGSESIEMVTCDTYFNLSNMNCLFQCHEPPSSKLSYEHGSEFYQCYFDAMVSASI